MNKDAVKKIMDRQDKCPHEGVFASAGQLVFPVGGNLVIAQAIVCTVCGFTFITNFNTNIAIDMPTNGSIARI